MRIIDAHVHIWPASWPGSEPVDFEALPYPRELDASAEALIARMDENGIERAVVVQSPWWAHDDGYLLDAARRHPERFNVMGCLPLILEDADFEAEAARIGADRLEGVRITFTGPNPLAVAAGGKLDPIYRRASDAGLPLIFLSRDQRIYEHYHRIARDYPDLRMIIEHMGHASAGFNARPTTLDEFVGLARYPNIYVKLAVHHQHSMEAFPWRDVFPIQTRIIDEFGAQRTFWGSNWPMKLPDPDYTQRLSTVRDHFPFRSEADKAWVLAETAARLWPNAAADAARTEARAAAAR